MLIHHDPDEYEGVSSSHTCSFHQRNPGKPYAGCTCSVSWGLKRRDSAEVAKIKTEKRRQHENEILSEAEAIKARRKLET